MKENKQKKKKKRVVVAVARTLGREKGAENREVEKKKKGRVCLNGREEERGAGPESRQQESTGEMAVMRRSRSAREMITKRDAISLYLAYQIDLSQKQQQVQQARNLFPALCRA